MTFVCFASVFRPPGTILYKILDIGSLLELRKKIPGSQNECCTVAVHFFVFSDVLFSLKAAILSSVYVTIDTGASSAAELCFATFSGFDCFGHFLVQVMNFVVFWYSEA